MLDFIKSVLTFGRSYREEIIALQTELETERAYSRRQKEAWSEALDALQRRFDRHREETQAVIERERVKPQRVRYTTLKAFDPNGENYLTAIYNIGQQPEWRFFMHMLKENAITAAKGGAPEHQQKAIGWLEGFDLVDAQMERTIREYAEMVAVTKDAEDEDSEISLS